ncbi:MAG: T9SS type A sorting domain-containing protein [Ignavibacteriae bacterium]|nr:T9SS type A sorting domain-containing protein [Ignavibacteriota bacterium]MCB9243917.1 T9SS type A sorting domain-containing protein [Ignavibacteriales bacterium]
MVRKLFTVLLFIVLASGVSFAGSNPYALIFESVTIPSAPNIQSFVFAQSNGKWLIIGGRTNGLHGFTPQTAFPPQYQNKYAYVIDPGSGQVWSRELALDLSFSQADPLRSTNQQYVQVGNNLYVTGGYGLDSNSGQLVTFGKLSVIDVDGMINAVVSGTTMSPYVKQLNDSRVRVTGGEMAYMNGFVYLVGGHNFNGVYFNTGQGNNNQVYTNAYKKFHVNVAGSTVSIADYVETVDTVNFHRRDYNLVPAIKPDGSEYLIVYGGVFKYGINRPFQTPIELDNSGATVDSFEEQLNQYTTANMNLFDSTTNDMYTMIFGGMGLYYYDTAGSSIEMDTLVPFTKDITLMTRNVAGNYSETRYPVRMPGFLGSNAKFIPNPNLPTYDNGVIKFRSLNSLTLAGYIFGGIKATDPNPGTGSMGSTSASDVILKVYIRPSWVDIHNISGEVPSGYKLSQNYPNPFNPSTNIAFDITKPDFVKLAVYNSLGQKVAELVNKELSAGSYEVTWNAGDIAGGVYFYRLETGSFSETKKMVVVK